VVQKVCVIGDNCVNIYPKSGKSSVGGNGINSAIALKRNGIDAGYVGIIGNDEEGELIISVKICGKKFLIWFMISIRWSRSLMPMSKCIPKINRRYATICM